MPGRSAELTGPERRLRVALLLFTLLFTGLAGSYLFQGFFADSEYPFVANSVAKDGLFAVLCAIAAADLRRNGWATLLVVAGHALIVASLLGMLAFGDVSSVAGTFGDPPGIDLPQSETLLFIWLPLAAAVTVALFLLYRSAQRARYGLRYLAPHQHQTAMALAEVLVMGDDELLTPEQIAKNIDDYLYSFSAQEKWKSKLAFSALTIYPLLRLRAPYPLMSPQSRLEFVEQRFLNEVAERRLPGPLRRMLQSMLFAAQQLTFIGYYASPETAAATGYVPFSKRPRYARAMKAVDHGRRGVDVREPREIDADTVNADVAIVGSGAAGALLAEKLAAKGREVLVLERGKHVDPREFTEDERIQFSNLYSDGGMQMSRDARFQVLQGMCVGGTTVVNNAVCFDLPPEVLDRWNDADGLDAGVDEKRLARSFKATRRSMGVQKQGNRMQLTENAKRFRRGIRELKLDREGHFDVVEANIADCYGCGYCNIGCAYGRKLSALDLVLPRAQAKHGSDAFRVFSECRADRIEKRNGRATGLRCRLSDGRKLRVNANTVVVSAGAMASSLLLRRSRIGGRGPGSTLGFNMGAPMTAEFEDKLDSYDGLQISHYLRPPGDDGLVLETWFNPVGAQSLFMPGWFTDHFNNMRRYDRMGCAGSVVGTERNAKVKPGFRGRMKLDYTPTDSDLRRLVDGLKLVGRIFLQAGAVAVMPTTFRYLRFTSPEELEVLDDHVRDNTDIQLHSSHPQGGNPVSRDPEKGIVDESFRPFGFENLYVCDASVFPSPITVNPQLTVMALADYAADGIE